MLVKGAPSVVSGTVISYDTHDASGNNFKQL